MPHPFSKKFTRSHTSLIEAAEAPIKAAADLSCVSKVSLGIIRAIGNGPISMKVTDEGPGCLLVKVRGPRSIQEIRVYTSEKEVTMIAMNAMLKKGS